MKKYLKFYEHPIGLLTLWIFYLATFAGAAIRYKYITNQFFGPDVFGKLANFYWHLAPIFLVGFVTMLAVAVLKFSQGRGNSWDRVILYVVGGSSVITFFIASYLLGLELSKYNNFLYSTYGITKDSVYWLSNISLMIMVVFAGMVYFGRSKSADKKLQANKIALYFSLGVLVWYSLLSFSKASNYIWYAKFDYSWVFENFGQISELNANVPENGTIIIPPQDKRWPDISNGPIVRYFLFPRTIVSSLYLDSQENAGSVGSAYFVVLNSGDIQWPQIKSDKKTIIFDERQIEYDDLGILSENNNIKVFKVIFK